MLSIHGLVRIKEREVTKKINDNYFVINMKVETCERKRNFDGEYDNRFDIYDTFMSFSNESDADMWSEQLEIGRVLDVRWAQLQGLQKNGDGELKGWIKVRLWPDIRLTIPK